jgi:cytochrome P450
MSAAPSAIEGTSPPPDPTAKPAFFADGGIALQQWLRGMREHHPVWFDEPSQTWRVYRHDDAVRVLSDWEVFSNDMGRVMPAQELVDGNVSMMDPPRHRQLRALVSPAFTPRALDRLVPKISEVSRGLLEAMADADEPDFIAGLAYPLPATVIAELLGIPAADRAVLERCADAQIKITCVNPADPGFIQARDAAMQELLDYLRGLCRQRRRQPREDLVSRLVAAEADGARLADEEIVCFAALLLLAGYVTTMGLLSNAVFCLHEHPDTMSALRNDPGLVPRAVEEILRYRPPVPDAARITNAAVEVRGQTIPADKLVLVSTMSANRDPQQFGEPNRFDVRRHPNPQLTFSYGIHFCLGAPLARLEADVVLRTLLAMFSGVEVTDVAWQASHALTGPQRMLVGLRRAR